ncbi:MAG: hypothetical protein JWP04_447 [Belnapia sp.]|nr:hypothetical protein [Belnapia sp.]
MPIRTARRAANNLLGLLYRTPFWSEVWSGIAAVLWSLISILGSGDVTHRPSFAPLGELAPTWVWEGSGVILGIGQLTAVTVNQWPARWVAAFMLAAWWMLLTICILQYDAAAPTWGVYLCYAISNLVSMARLVRRS